MTPDQAAEYEHELYGGTRGAAALLMTACDPEQPAETRERARLSLLVLDPLNPLPEGEALGRFLEVQRRLPGARRKPSNGASATTDPTAGEALAPAVLVRVSSVTAERVGWLWADRLPLGKLAVLDGDPGLGKSTLTLDLAARVSSGGELPEDSREREPAGVVLLNAEDGIADTIRPRLEAAGADLSRVVVLTATRDSEGKLREPSLPADVPALRYAIRETRAALVVVDPLMAYLAAGVDSHRDQDVRGALRLLAGLAEAECCAVVIVRHLNKTMGGHPIYRGGGSIGIIGAARSGLLVAADRSDPARRVLAATKSNLGPLPPALAYRIVPAGAASRIEWEGVAEGVTAGDLLRPADESEPGPRQQAEEWLAELLVDGPVGARDVRRQAEEAGLSWATVRRAQSSMRVRATRTGGLGQAGAWYWEAPAAPKVLTDALRRSPVEGEHLRSAVSTLGSEAPGTDDRERVRL